MSSEYNQDQGLDAIDAMLRNGDLRRVPISTEIGEWMIGIAGNHVQSAATIATSDPHGASSLVYSAARKALTGLLYGQGLAVGPGVSAHHATVIHAVRVQLVPPHNKLFDAIDDLRSERNNSEYAHLQQLPISESDLQSDITAAQKVVDLCTRLIKTIALPNV